MEELQLIEDKQEHIHDPFIFDNVNYIEVC